MWCGCEPLRLVVSMRVSGLAANVQIWAQVSAHDPAQENPAMRPLRRDLQRIGWSALWTGAVDAAPGLAANMRALAHDPAQELAMQPSRRHLQRIGWSALALAGGTRWRAMPTCGRASARDAWSARWPRDLAPRRRPANGSGVASRRRRRSGPMRDRTANSHRWIFRKHDE